MVRSILTTPDAKPLFAKAISVSDTSDYSISSASQAGSLGEMGLQALGCGNDDLACARSKSSDEVLQATFSAYQSYPQSDSTSPAGEVYRPVQGIFIPSSLEKDVSSGKGIGKDVVSVVDCGSLVVVELDFEYPFADPKSMSFTPFFFFRSLPPFPTNLGLPLETTSTQLNPMLPASFSLTGTPITL